MLSVKDIKSELVRRIESPLFGKLVKISDDQNNFCILPEKYSTTSYMTKIKEMKVYDDDIWIVSLQNF